MHSIYGRLFRYRERSERSPLEDFLSESLADLFNRLPKAEKIGLIARLLLPPASKESWAASMEAAAIIRMETQYAIPNGRIDIVVLFDNEPVVVIENKINSPLGHRLDGSDQLASYGLWLKRRADASGGALTVICFLTHTTKPPGTFVDGRLDLYGSTPKVLHWSEVASELRNIAQSETLRWDIRTLADELYYFLLGEDMTTEAPRLEDFAAAILYVRAGTRISNAFEEIYEHLCSFGFPFSKGSILDDCSLDFDSASSVVHGWKYLSVPSLKTAHFAYGIALQPRQNLLMESNGSKSTIPAEDSIFLSFAVETKREMAILRERAKMLGPSWHLLSFSDASMVATFRPFKTVLVQPEGFAESMKGWINEAVPEIITFINGMQNQPPT